MCVAVPDRWPAKLPETGMLAKLSFVFPRCLDIFSFDLYACIYHCAGLTVDTAGKSGRAIS